MLRPGVILFSGALLLSGCTVRSAVPEAEYRPEAVRWVEGPTPEVHTLLLSPIRIGDVGGAGHAASELEVGAFFARFEQASGPVDQLALMIEVQGTDAPGLLAKSRQLLLEVDGELFVGEPGSTANSFRVDLVGDDPRATVVIPISPQLLHHLATAEVVRGRLGLWATFTVPASSRRRFRALLEALPEDAALTSTLGSQLRRSTTTP